MTLLIIGIGIPGSGKTTFLKKLAAKKGLAYLSPDEVRKELTGNEGDQTVNAQAWSIAKGRLASLLADEESVVFDATFAKSDERREFLEFARRKNATVVHGYYFDVPLEIAKERNANRSRVVRDTALERLHAQLQERPPMKEEGFDTLFLVDEFERVLAT